MTSPASRALHYFLIMLSCFCIAPVFANASPLQLPQRASGVDVANHVSYWKSPSRTTRFSDAKNAFDKGKFVPSNGQLNQGFTDSAYWYHLSFENTASVYRKLVLENAYPIIDQIDIHCDTESAKHFYRLGDHTHKHGRLLDVSRITVVLDMPPLNTATCFIKVVSSSNLTLQLKLYDTDEYIAIFHEKQWVLGTFYGLCLALWLLGVALFFFYGDLMFALFSLHVFGVAALSLLIDRSAFSFWAMLGLQDIMVMVMTITVVISNVQLSIRYLAIGDISPWLVRCSHWYCVYLCLLFCAFIAIGGSSSTEFLVISSALYPLLIMVMAWRGRFRRRVPAYLILGSWVCFSVILILQFLDIYGVLSCGEWYLDGDKYGWSLELLCTAFGLLYLIKHNLVQTPKKRKRSTKGPAATVGISSEDVLKRYNDEVRQAVDNIKKSLATVDNDALDEQQREQLAQAHVTAQRLRATGERYLTSEQIRTGTLPTTTTEVDTERLLRDCIRWQHSNARRKGLQLLGAISAGVPRTIKTDSTRVREALVNLLSVAIRHTDVGFVRLSLALSDDILDQQLVLAFVIEYTRNGAQQQVNDVQDELNINESQALLESLNGNMEFHNVSGHGSRFEIKIPVTLSEEADCFTVAEVLDFSAD